MKNESPIYSYYYPLTTSCDTLRQRTLANGGNTPTDETMLCQTAGPLFLGHSQPNVYSFDGSPESSTWDDIEPRVMQVQIDLAQQYGVDGFIFDTYVGVKDGKVSKEKDVINGFLKCNLGKVAYACMMIFGRPRSVLPIPPYFEESDRYYDRTPQTVETMVDYLADNHWDNPNYINILDRPYVSVFTSDMRKYSNNNKDMSHADMINYMKEYSWRKYRIEPYLATVCLRATHALDHLAAGADSMIGYGFLPDFTESMRRPIQNYREQVIKRVEEWDTIQEQIDKPYIPPVVVGWDASPRGSIPEGRHFRDVQGMYPFTPIVTDSNAIDFGDMLCQQKRFIMNNTPQEERYTPITAWNEITEGAALLPKILPDGSVDDSYLAKIRELRDEYGF